MRLTAVRHANRGGKNRNKIIITLLFFALGFLLGMMAKGLDVTAANRLPVILQKIDIGNLFGRTTVWALIALTIALFSKSPLRAAVNVLLFFVGMLGSYCLFSVVWAGFMLDTSYLMIWVVLTAVSPVLAYIAWYARGRGLLGTIVSALIIAYFILEAFSFNAGLEYFDVAYSVVEVFFLVAVISMLYVRWNQCFISVGAAVALAYLVKLTGFSIPYVL